MSENNEFDPIQEDLAADAAEAAEDAASNLTESTAETVNEPASEAAAPNSGTEENTEYHYVRPEGRLYSDADYTRQEDTTAPPRYYTPPEKKPKPRQGEDHCSGTVRGSSRWCTGRCRHWSHYEPFRQ